MDNVEYKPIELVESVNEIDELIRLARAVSGKSHKNELPRIKPDQLSTWISDANKALKFLLPTNPEKSETVVNPEWIKGKYAEDISNCAQYLGDFIFYLRSRVINRNPIVRDVTPMEARAAISLFGVENFDKINVKFDTDIESWRRKD